MFRHPGFIPSWGIIGSCIYLTGFTLPYTFTFDPFLFALAVCSAAVAVSHRPANRLISTPLILPVALFLVSSGVSILLSADTTGSLRASTSILPGILLFFLVSSHVDGTSDIYLLYLTCSAVALALAAELLWACLGNRGGGPFNWVTRTGSPILVVKNDVVFLAILSPLSLAAYFYRPKGLYGVVPMISLLLCLVIPSLFQSRGAAVTMLFATSCFFLLFRPKLLVAYGIVALGIMLLADAATGFRLMERSATHGWNSTARLPFWLCAWDMLLDAPVVGQGPHTFGSFYAGYLRKSALPPGLIADPRAVPWPHNLYLEVLAERGLAGFAALSLVLVHGFSGVRKLMKSASDETRILGYGAGAALAGFCLAATIELTFLRQWVVIVLFMLTGVISQLVVSKNG